VGQLLREALSARAVAARYGDEEFCIILRDCHDSTTAHAFAEQRRLKFESLRIKVRRTDEILNSIIASFGFASAQPGNTLKTLIPRADDALYQAKRDGRNQVNPTPGNDSRRNSSQCLIENPISLLLNTPRVAESDS
jgi:diguanylate cyclase